MPRSHGRSSSLRRRIQTGLFPSRLAAGSTNDDAVTPLVSIIVPACNSAAWLASTLESALAQVGPQIEVIVVDDGSTDATLDVARGFEPRVRVARQANQ